MTVDLEKKLVSQKKVTLAKLKEEQRINDQLLGNVKNILSAEFNSDIEQLKRAGFGTALQNAQELQNSQYKIEQQISNKSERIFTLEEIKQIAFDYDLRFLPTSYYKGVLPNDLAIKIKDAEELNKATMASLYDSNVHFHERMLFSNSGYPRDYNYSMSPLYSILAPMNSFNLEARPKDPLLFLHLKDNTYYLVHKWGDDLSVLRRIKGFINYSSRRTWGSVFLLFIVSALIFGYYDNAAGFFISVVLGVLFIVVSVIFNIEKEESIFSNNKEDWNSTYTD